MQISTSLNIIYGRNGVQCDSSWLAKIAEVGYDGLDFNFLDIISDIDWFNQDTADEYIDNLGADVEKNNLTWFQAHAPIYNFFLNDAQNECFMKLCEPAIRACGRLKVPWLVFHPSQNIGYNASTQYNNVLQRNKEHFQRMLEFSEKYDVGIAIENMPASANNASCYCRNAEELCELIEAINHPLAGVCWDTGHAKVSGLFQKKQINMVGTLLKVLHIHDNDGMNDDHLLPYTIGANSVNWHDVVEGLKAVSYSGALNLEAHNPFSRMPDELLFDTIKYSAAILKHIATQM